MLAKVAGFVFALAKWFLLIVGALVVGLVWWLVSGDGKPKPAKEAEPVAAIEQRAADVPAAQDVVCACSSGAVCTGPRGGQYCLTADGKKRYRATP